MPRWFCVATGDNLPAGRARRNDGFGMDAAYRFSPQCAAKERLDRNEEECR